jgi:sec-independent protein translocase protein TatC
MTPGTPGPAFAADDPFDHTEEELDDRSRMTFLEHLDELRRRLIYAIWALAICFAVTFWYWEPMYRYLTTYFQANGGSLIYNRPTSGFMFSLKVSGVAALLVAAPFVFTQLWLFVAPGLYAREKRVVVPFVFFSSVLFFTGALFAHMVAFPTMWKFFASYQLAGTGVQFLPTLDETFGFYVYTLLGAGVVFQMPMLVFFLARFGIVTAGFLLRKIKYAILIIFIVAAVITPSSDVVTQTVFAAPMIALYIVSIGVAWLFGKKRPREEA